MKKLFVICFLPLCLTAADFPEMDSSSMEDALSTDALKIGGSFDSQFNYYDQKESKWNQSPFSNPNEMLLYFDAQKSEDVRFFAKGRYTFTPTNNETKVNPLTLKNYKKEEAVLDELKVNFQSNHTLFFTVGKQKIKWGAGKFWNPTDFVNTSTKDPLRTDDKRSGVSLIKVHRPIGAANLYAIAAIDDAENAKNVSPALRAELPLKNSEISFSALLERGTDQHLGADLSIGLGDIDFYLEASALNTPKLNFDDQKEITAGFSYEIKYSDEDSLTLTPEIFYKQAGLKGHPNYTNLLFTQNYIPYQTSRMYGMFAIYLPKPLAFNDHSFTIFTLANLEDHSQLSKVMWTISKYKDLTFIPSTSFHYGDRLGEFCFGNQKLDLGLELKLDF